MITFRQTHRLVLKIILSQSYPKNKWHPFMAHNVGMHQYHFPRAAPKLRNWLKRGTTNIHSLPRLCQRAIFGRLCNLFPLYVFHCCVI